uniref:Uncharacterized protein n=1 Tax=Cacopsylla melanoneura TaxID=428564 RepID=A0A8D8XG13_9HEMI
MSPEEQKRMGASGRSRDLKNTGAPCSVCRKVYHNIGYLRLSHQNKCRETYERLVKGAKGKPHRVYRRGRYKMIQFKHNWRTTVTKVSTAASSDWIMQFYNEQPAET